MKCRSQSSGNIHFYLSKGIYPVTQFHSPKIAVFQTTWGLVFGSKIRFVKLYPSAGYFQVIFHSLHIVNNSDVIFGSWRNIIQVNQVSDNKGTSLWFVSLLLPQNHCPCFLTRLYKGWRNFGFSLYLFTEKMQLLFFVIVVSHCCDMWTRVQYTLQGPV